MKKENPEKKKQRKQNNTQESTAQKLSFWWSNSVTIKVFFPGNALKVKCALSKINMKGKYGIYLPLHVLRLVGWAPDFKHWVTLLFKCLHFRTLQLTMWVGQQTVHRRNIPCLINSTPRGKYCSVALRMDTFKILSTSKQYHRRVMLCRLSVSSLLRFTRDSNVCSM